MAYTEPYDALDEKTREISRAITSLREELEAIDWYNQRVATSKDKDLKEVMAHNRDEEIEHACLGLEWLRRNMPVFDTQLKTYLFTTGSLIAVETGGQAGAGSGSRLTIGDMKDK